MADAEIEQKSKKPEGRLSVDVLRTSCGLAVHALISTVRCHCRLATPLLNWLPDSAFKQQRLPAWQPLLTPKWVIGTFFVIGIVFLPIGIAIVLYSQEVGATSPVVAMVCAGCCSELFVLPFLFSRSGITCPALGSVICQVVQVTKRYDDICAGQTVCNVNVTIPSKMTSPVYVYYQLTNFYQNHRRFGVRVLSILILLP